MSSVTPPNARRISALPRILCVDDDRQLLAGLELRLRRKFDVVTATSAADALATLDLAAPFAAVISDMRMPQSDGVTFLSAIRRVAPATTRILLTGQASVSSTIAAVNSGEVFRILLKPIEAPELIAVLDEAVAAHREQLRQDQLALEALRCPLTLLSSVLPVVAPALAQQLARRRALATDMTAAVAAQHVWVADLTAMIVHIALARVPAELARQWCFGEALPTADYARVAQAMHDAIAPLRGVSIASPVCCAIESLLTLPASKEGEPMRRPRTGASGGSVPARAVRLTLDFDARLAEGESIELALAGLRALASDDEETLVDALARSPSRWSVGCRHVTMAELQLGEHVQHGVRRPNGVLLLPKGHEVSHETLLLIRSLDSESRHLPVVTTPAPSSPSA